MVLTRVFRIAVVCALPLLLLTCQVSASSGRSNEITDIHFENVTQASLDVVWNTAHPSTSQVMIARDTNYEPERWAPTTADAVLVTTHRVTVDHLFPYNQATGAGQYYIYVASVDSRGEMSTAPGPQTGDGKNPLLSMRALPTDTSGVPNFKLYTLGPTEVFAGSDMYFLVQSVLISGPVGNLYIHNQHGYNNGSDGVVKYEGTSNTSVTPDTISVHLSCTWSNPSALDSNEQTLDPLRNLGFCNKGNNMDHDLTFRLRTQPNTTPGKYSVTVTLETNGQQQTVTYEFTVLPAPTAPSRPQLTITKIPGLSTWEKQMVELGDKWCAYRDQQNAAGNFVDNWGWTGDAWFYDGGRVFDSIDSYTAAAGHANHSHWQHCALTILAPYANYQIANNGAMAGYSMFTYGMAMNYMRTHSQVMRDAINILATVGPQHVACGAVDPWGIRENAYRSNAWMSNEMLGAPRWPLLQRNIDKLMGNLNMVANGQAGAVHPFLIGIAMDTLIHWYELNLAEGHPDYRVLPVIKEALDGLWRDNWLPQQKMFDYNRYILPVNRTLAYTALNNLVSVAYAWYWLQTGDSIERDRGDLLFRHAFDSPDYGWSGKQFSQLYEYGFDFVRYRQGLASSSVAPENNPFAGPYADTDPPISEKVNCDRNYYRGCKPGTIGSTTATIFWNTYKPATTQLTYGKTTAYGQISDLDRKMVVSHTVLLTNLQPGTTYHFRTRSVDTSDNVGSMHDLTFTTLLGKTSGSQGP
jgi:hypothetical protein